MILTKENIDRIDTDSIISNYILQGKLQEFLLIVPTNRKQRNLKKEIISSSPHKSTEKINIETLGTISVKLLKESKNFIELSEAASFVFLNQSFAEVKLNYFTLYKNQIPRGTVERIKNVISLYKKGGISPDKIRNEAEKLDRGENLKANDIAVIYEDYLERCFCLNAFEIGDIYNELVKLEPDEFHKNFITLFPEVKMIVVSGFDEFTLPEINIIDSLSKTGSRLYLNFDYYLFNKNIFAHLDNCYESLEAKGFKKIIDLAQSPRDKFRDFVREKLFVESKPPNNKNYKNVIGKITGPDRIGEIEAVAKEIKKLILTKTVQPHKICVAFNLIRNYSGTIRDIFTAYEIPFNLSDRIPLDSSLPVTAVVNFLEILENNFYYKNIFRALSGGFVSMEEIDTYNLYGSAVKLKLVAGADVWIDRLKEEIDRRKFYDEENLSENNDKLSFERALEDFRKIAGMLESFKKKMTIREFLDNLYRLVIKLEIPRNLLKLNSVRQEEYIKGLTVFFDTIDEIFGLIEMEKGGNEKFSLPFFLDQIRIACNRGRFNIKEKSDYGVQVTTLNEIRGLKFDYLFIGGLCDGDFPTKYSPEIFFSGSFRKRELVHITEERYLFYQALCS